MTLRKAYYGFSVVGVKSRLLYILPADIISEELYGPYAYVDDIWLCAYPGVFHYKLDDDTILVENWADEVPLLSLLGEVLEKSRN